MGDIANAFDFLNRPRSGHDSTRMVHRDVTPDNILLFKRTAKLSDFGRAVFVEDDLAPVGEGKGWEYSPPEFYFGITTRTSDQWILAATWCEIRGGRLPF